jgi:hypothetical protein
MSLYWVFGILCCALNDQAAIRGKLRKTLLDREVAGG